METNRPEQDILETNNRFYRALAQADLAGMDEVWAHSPKTECVHPGWDRLRGWPAIRESWRRIFQGQGPQPVDISDILVHRRGDMAWVTCYENIARESGLGSVQISQMLATNVYERIDGRWRLVIHHTSPSPPTQMRPRTWQTSLN